MLDQVEGGQLVESAERLPPRHARAQRRLVHGHLHGAAPCRRGGQQRGHAAGGGRRVPPRVQPCLAQPGARRLAAEVEQVLADAVVGQRRRQLGERGVRVPLGELDGQPERERQAAGAPRESGAARGVGRGARRAEAVREEAVRGGLVERSQP
ncbi:hypothetical protein CRI70_03895 [Streptomyces sp. Ru87]|nr:hypothetical protein CRI70_03895 [Streptomyces sp. Ru87]